MPLHESGSWPGGVYCDPDHGDPQDSRMRNNVYSILMEASLNTMSYFPTSLVGGSESTPMIQGGMSS